MIICAVILAGLVVLRYLTRDAYNRFRDDEYARKQ